MSKPLLCVTVTAATTAELRRRRDEVADADLIELRLDSVADPNVAGALAGRRRAVLVTCRPTWEGGHFTGSEEERKRLLSDALALGADYVDFEWRAGFDDLIAQRGGRSIVISSHDFDGVPSDLTARLQAMRSTGAQIVKLAVTTRTLSDCVPLLDLATHEGRQGGLVLIGMGEHGLATRVLASRFGSMWTYAGWLREIGQVDASTLLNDYRFRSLSESTDVYGLVAGSVSHSVSGAMHNAAFQAARRDAVYLPFPAATADDFVTFGRAIGINGASVTIPHKVALFERVDEVDAVSCRIGAINTIKVRGDGRWIGGNTDASGFLQPLQERVPLAGLRAAVLGAGGAARAVAVALASCGCVVSVHARDRVKAEAIAALTSAQVGSWPPAPGSWDLLINCTPIGMHPRVDETPVPAEQLTGRYVYDLVYNPTVTRLLREAAAVGCQTIGGLDMLVAQAHEQYQWWTDTRPAPGVMREAALKRLAEFVRDENYVV
jgi:3-dehydroquinate dehydratase / shikimate dehydrogenase